ncbi:cyclin-dependent protein kinase [Ordospora colligata]|uniref:Cyclin-dependent protein kinase n=1 Tax=Ordospora colligata OC4 TaxID=1354746 RepID=A0A0B2UI47_9MICR|nr:cyclin-dependent protein kinase [Ordospora colligata OC4]KHN68894.1 cyclin-dependent protein kinase [Ordospora colligata OC4]TBU13928.1 cyclin-dependent protein kinase [Ordospora colligata]TBU14117.1 cyclin-dependent protein kinase [Ordospora colligata]TBU17786.1 cyclin-dependent protein kinase [Ordospora colligata]
MGLMHTVGRCRSISVYEKINNICSGSFGSVYKVRCKESKNIFAIKRMNPSMCHDTNGFSVLYIREVMILRHLQHNNIMRINEVVEGAAINDFFIVMEYCDTDLKTLIQKAGPMDESMAMFFTNQLLQGLEFLHGIGVIHRDLKPSNILLMRDGCLKIADFGLARRISSQMTNLVVTLWYRPIEVLLGSESYDESVDMWSVGCIVGEMMVGEPIMPGEGEIDQLRRVFELLGYPDDKDLHGLELPHLKSIRIPDTFNAEFDKRFNGMDGEVVEFIRNMLSFDPRKRDSAHVVLSKEIMKNSALSNRDVIECSITKCID